MGKLVDRRLPVAQQPSSGGRSSRVWICRRCSRGLCRIFSFKCAVVLLFSIAAFLSALFGVLPRKHREDGFDAGISVELRATVQSYFKLQKPVSELVPYISRLEYDINDEIGVPSLKVALLSMHQANSSNWTNVVFGFIPETTHSSMNPVALSLLKSSLIDLFLRRCNLMLTSSLFGEPSSFEILKFPGGLTIIPEPVAIISMAHFSFTLGHSIFDLTENLAEFKQQLGLGLHLLPNEDLVNRIYGSAFHLLDQVVHIQITNKHGSTREFSVIVEVSVASDIGTILPERLRQLALIITGSRAENLGLNHSIFGNVNEISLSSFLSHSLQPPTPSPYPSPYPSSSPSPSPSRSPSRPPRSPSSKHNGSSMVPSHSPALLPNSRHPHPPPSAKTPRNAPHPSSSPTSDPGNPPVSYPSISADSCRDGHCKIQPNTICTFCGHGSRHLEVLLESVVGCTLADRRSKPKDYRPLLTSSSS